MAEKQVTVRQCDVTGGSRNVCRYRVRIEKLPDPPDPTDAEPKWQLVANWKRDLCPRALDRLSRFVDRGVTRPGEKPE